MIDYESKIREILLQARISKAYKGYAYLERAIFLVLEDESRLCRVYDEVYTRIGKQFGVAPTAVEKNLRTLRDAFGKTAVTNILKTSAESLCTADHFLAR